MDKYEDYGSVYSVYSLTDGAVFDDIGLNGYDEALDEFEGMKSRLISEREQSASFPETTVHLYDAALGSMMAEFCIPQKG